MMEMKSNTDRRTDQINIWLRIFYHRSQLFGFTICGHNFQYNMIRRFYSIFFYQWESDSSASKIANSIDIKKIDIQKKSREKSDFN